MSETKRDLLPVLPLRDMVVVPHGVHPLFVGTKSSIVALDSAMVMTNRYSWWQKRSEKTDSAQMILQHGTVATILQLLLRTAR